MEDQKKYPSSRHFLMILTVSLLSFSNVGLATSTDVDIKTAIEPGVSMVGLNYAVNNKFIFSPRTLQWQAINENGEVVRTGHGSGGRGYCPDIKRSCRTPSGTYHVIAKKGASCRSSRYPVGKGGAPMPYCMYFYQGYTIHAAFDVPYGNASHGCIRVWPSAAKWLNEEFIRVGTQVTVLAYDDEDEVRVQ